jgi:nicotinate-nucleotide pyrophosphorylase (carboxylating)
MKDSNLIIEEHIRLSIAEDLGNGDHTSMSTIPAEAQGKMQLLVKESGIIAGIEVAETVFHLVDPEIIFTAFLKMVNLCKPVILFLALKVG